MSQSYKSQRADRRRFATAADNEQRAPGERERADAQCATDYYSEMNLAFAAGNVSKLETVLYEFEILTTQYHFAALSAFEGYGIPSMLIEVGLRGGEVVFPDKVRERALSILENLTMLPEDGFTDILLDERYNILKKLIKEIECRNLRIVRYLLVILTNLADVGDAVAEYIFSMFPFGLIIDILTMDFNELDTILLSVRVKAIALLCKLVPSQVKFDHFNILYRIVDHLLNCRIQETILYILCLINKICCNLLSCEVLSKDKRITELLNYVIESENSDKEELNQAIRIINKYFTFLENPISYPRINFVAMVKLLENDEDEIAETSALFISKTAKIVCLHTYFRAINVIPYFKSGFAMHGFGVQKQIINAACSLIETSTIDEINELIRNNITALLTISLDIDDPDLIYRIFKSLILVFKYQDRNDDGESIPELEFIENDGMNHLQHIDYKNQSLYDIVYAFTQLFDDGENEN